MASGGTGGKLLPRVDGKPLNAAFDVVGTGTAWTITFESRGGEKNSAGLERNSDYYAGIDIVLDRLADIGASLDVAYMASGSRVVQALPLAQRELEITAPYPVNLAACDLRRLRLDLCAAQTAPRFRQPGAKGGGNGTKRFEIRVSLPQPAADDGNLISGLVGGFGDASPRDIFDYPGVRTPGISEGSGYIVDVDRRLAIERAAMDAAWRHYEPDWHLEDVSAQRGLGYDIYAERNGDRRYIEVKGTASQGLTVGVTAKEVETAQREGITDLFILWGIQFDSAGTAHGRVRIISPWLPDADSLVPRDFEYSVKESEVRYPPAADGRDSNVTS